jgi:hypothetical protein
MRQLILNRAAIRKRAAIRRPHDRFCDRRSELLSLAEGTVNRHEIVPCSRILILRREKIFSKPSSNSRMEPC